MLLLHCLLFLEQIALRVEEISWRPNTVDVGPRPSAYKGLPMSYAEA